MNHASDYGYSILGQLPASGEPQWSRDYWRAKDEGRLNDAFSIAVSHPEDFDWEGEISRRLVDRGNRRSQWRGLRLRALGQVETGFGPSHRDAVPDETHNLIRVYPMCMCGKPTINGEPGYSWNGEPSHIRPIQAPDLREGDELLYDEPGRCGGTDSHSHHFRVVKNGGLALLVRHGGGDQRVDLGHSARKGIPQALAALDSNGRYWLLAGIYYAIRDAEELSLNACNAKWRKAAAEKRIKTRRLPSRGMVKVWIEPEAAKGEG